MADSLYPPHSRLYITCDRETTEEELTSAFKQYGVVANVNLCRDRATGNPKGFAFVQFENTSEAANAMEALNGKTIGQSSRPIKVTVALPKEQTYTPGGSDPSQFLRLFLVVPKTSTENDLREYFSQFGSVDTVSIVKDRETKESKGYAYVKFRKFSEAARAYENCDRRYKVVFAKPKEQSSGGRPMEHGSSTGAPYMDRGEVCKHIDDNPEGYTSLRAVVSADLSNEQIEWLFDIPPGLEFVHFFNEPPALSYKSMYTRKLVVKYDSPGTAAYALRKLDGFEYPAGERVIVQPDFQLKSRSSMYDRQRRAAPVSVSDLMQQVETLTKSLGEATHILKTAGLSGNLGNNTRQLEAFRCTANLPPPQPLAPSNSTTQERLFVVCEPGLPPQDALWDVFGRFGNLKELYILNGKNCGYANYADRISAHRAMQALSGQELYRMKLKVMIADPQREDRKRPRTNYD